MIRKLICAALAAGVHLVWPTQAEAAEGYDNCTGFIDSIPAVITTQGTWCLRKDLSTAMFEGNAIEVATNNVTVDCNDFKIGGLAAGSGTEATGVRASERVNTTIRHCNIRGFSRGANLSGSGHLVEDNTFDGNTIVGIAVSGTGSEIRNNQVLDTGGAATSLIVSGIEIGRDGDTGNGVDVIDNTISGVAPDTPFGNPDGFARGIQTYGNGEGSIVGNRISGLASLNGGGVIGISNVQSGRTVIMNNMVTGPGGSRSRGIDCDDNQATAYANAVVSVNTAIRNCFSVDNVTE